MPLKSQRESDSRNVNRVMFDTITGVEEIYRKVVTPGLDNLNRASRLGIRLKSVHMVSNTLHQRPMTTSRLHTQTNPCFENIVVPLSSKHEDGSKRSHSSQPSRARSQSSKVSRLPHVPDNSTLSSKPVRSYYAENVPTGSSFERFQRPASVWTFSNQASRMEKGHEALNKCRHLKMTSEIIPHRVDRSYYMSGAPKKIHARYDIEDAEFQVMQDLTRSRLRSRTTTPSARSAPACAPPSLAQSERTPRRELMLNNSDGLPVNLETKSERESLEDTNQLLGISNEESTPNTDPKPPSHEVIEYAYKTEDDSSVDNDWPPVRVLKKENNPILKNNQGRKSSMETTQEEDLNEHETFNNMNNKDNTDISLENHKTSPNTAIIKLQIDIQDSFEKHNNSPINPNNNNNKDFAEDRDSYNQLRTPNLSPEEEIGTIIINPELVPSENCPVPTETTADQVPHRQNVVRSVEFKFPAEGPLVTTSRDGIRKAENGHHDQNSKGSESVDVVPTNPSAVHRGQAGNLKMDTTKNKTGAEATGNCQIEDPSVNSPPEPSKNQDIIQSGPTPIVQNAADKVPLPLTAVDQTRNSEGSTTSPAAIFTIFSDGEKTKKDDVLRLDFTEERKTSQSAEIDSEEEETDDGEITDWDIKLLSGVRSSFLKSDKKLSSLRANTGHLNAHHNPNLSWIVNEVYSFVNSEQQEVFEEHFRSLDMNGNGVVSRDDLRNGLFENSTQKDLNLFVKVFDLNKDNTVDLREFVTVAALNDKLCGNTTQDDSKPIKLDLPKLAYHITAFKEMFDLCDSDKDLSLTVEELMLMITAGVSEEIGTDKSLVDMIIQTVDSDHSGRIEFVEFLSFIPFFLGIFSHLLQKPALIENIERARCAVRKALKPKQTYRRHFKEKTKDIWDD